MNQQAFTREATDAQNPYMGLHPFEEKDAAYFYGRGQQTADLFRMVKRSTLTVLFGRSGLGKSSLLRAGLFPRLRGEGFFPISVRFDYESDEPLAAQLWSSIDAETAERRDDDTALKPGESVWAWFHRVPLWSERNRLLVPTLVFDQFEEAFTLGRSHRDLAGAMAQLADLIENRVPADLRAADLPPSYGTPKVKVILALREDYLPQLEDLRSLIPSLAGNRYRLLGMNGLQALEAVANPGEKIIDPPVAEKVVRFVASAGEGRDAATADLAAFEVEPALLSLVCRELNERRKQKGQATISEELLSGERSRIIEGFYERSVGDLHAGVREFVEDRLLTSDGYRTTVALSSARELPNVSDQEIETLIQRRILRKEERFGRPHLELIHDVLTRIVRASRDRRRDEARRVELLARKRAWIWRGLAAALVVIAMVVTGVLLLRRNAAKNAEREAARKLNRELAGQLEDAGREALLRGETDNAARLLNMGYRFLRQSGTRSRDHEMMLARALMSFAGRVAVLEHPPAIRGVDANGDVIATCGADGVIRLWNGKTFAAERAPVRPFVDADPAGQGNEDEPPKQDQARVVKLNPEFHSVLVAANGRIVGAAPGGRVEVIDGKTGRRKQLEAEGFEGGGAPRVCVSPDVRQIAAWRPGGAAVSVWRMEELWSLTAIVDARKSKPALVGPKPNEQGFTVADVECLNGGNLIVAGSAGTSRGARVWHEAGGAFTLTSELAHDAPALDDVTATPDARHAATAGGGRVIVWSLPGDAAAAVQASLPSIGVAEVELAGDGEHVIVTTIADDLPGRAVAQARQGERQIHDLPDAPRMTATVWNVKRGERVLSFVGGRVLAGLSPDGARFVAASSDRMELWDTAGWKKIREHRLDREELSGLAFHGRRVIVAAGGAANVFETAPPDAGDDQVLSWGLAADELAPLARVKVPVWGMESLAYHEGRKLVAFATRDETRHALLLLDPFQGRILATLHPDSMITRLQFDAQGGRVLGLHPDGTVSLWDAVAHRPIKTLRAPAGAPYTAVRFSADGRRFATGGKTGAICLWDAALGHALGCAQGAPRVYVMALAVHPREPIVAAGYQDGRVMVWDGGAARPMRRLGTHAGEVDAVEFAPGGGRIITTSSDRTAAVWDLAAGERVAVCPGAGLRLSVGSREGRFATAGALGTELWDPDGRLLYRLPAYAYGARVDEEAGILYTYDQSSSRSWDLATGAPIDAVRVPRLMFGEVTGRGELIAIDYNAGELVMFPRPRTALPAGEHNAAVVDGDVAAGGALVVTTDDLGASIFHSGAGKLHRLEGRSPPGAPPRFSPGGDWLAVAAGPNVQFFRTAPELQPGPSLLRPAAVSLLAWGRGNDAPLLVADESPAFASVSPNGELRPGGAIDARGPSERAALGPRGAQFALVKGDKVEIWSRAPFGRVATLATGGAAVLDVLLPEPDAAVVVARTAERLLLWRLPAPGAEPLAPVNALEGHFTAAWLSGDGTLLVAARGTGFTIYEVLGRAKLRPVQLDPAGLPPPEKIFGIDTHGRLLLTYRDGELSVWEMKSGRRLDRFDAGEVAFASFTPTGDVLTIRPTVEEDGISRWIVGSDRTWKLDAQKIDLKSLRPRLREPEEPADLPASPQTRREPAIIMAPGDPRMGLIIPESDETLLLVYDTKDKAAPIYALSARGGADFRFGDVRNEVWSISPAGVLAQWNLSDRKLTRAFHPQLILAGALAQGGMRVALAGGEGSLSIITATGSAQTSKPYVHRAPLVIGAFDATGERFAGAAADGSAILWNLGQAAPVALGAEGGGHERRITAMAFGARGLLVTASEDGSAKVWDPSGKLVHTLLGHTDAVRAVAFDKDAHWVATASDDGTTRIWSVDSGQALVSLSARDGAAAVREVSFSPDGRRLLTGSADGEVRLWNVDWSVGLREGGERVEATPDRIDRYLRRVLPHGGAGR